MGMVQGIVMSATTFRTGLEVAARAMISRAVGAGRTEYANHVLLQSLTVAVAFSAVVVVLGWTLAEPALRLFGLGDEVVRLAVPYMRIQLLTMTVWGIHGITGGTLQASGDVMTPLKSETVSRVAHLVLSPILIFGWFGMPSLELAGASAASLIARSVGLGINLYGLSTGSSRLRLRVRDYRFDGPLVWRLLRIGMPASATDIQRGLSRLAVMAVVAPFGATALAAFVETAAPWLAVIGLGYFAMAGVFVFVNALNTAGETVVPMVVTIALTWGVEVPLAFALSMFTPLEHMGVPWAIVAGTTLRFAVLAAYTAKGRWLRTGVL